MDANINESFKIPILDFTDFSLEVDEKDVDIKSLQNLADELYQAFSTSGFVYVKNYGISHEKVDEVRELARQFFELPVDIKQQYARVDASSNHGWVALERENLNVERPGDLKEAYNVTPDHANKVMVWPDTNVPNFKKTIMDHFEKYAELSNRIQYLMGLGLGLTNPNLFRENHNPMSKPCCTTLRLLYYPVLPPGTDIKPNQIRCGEHSDYGSITLLFQDDVGGLEVMNREGDFVPATPIPGTVLVNVADLVQRWTCDKLVSTKHRVVMPKEEVGRTKARISVAYFVHPDDDCLVECIDGSNKYEPITSFEYLKRRLDATYNY